jgi:membrane-associated phospholipid phosphatase
MSFRPGCFAVVLAFAASSLFAGTPDPGSEIFARAEASPAPQQLADSQLPDPQLPESDAQSRPPLMTAAHSVVSEVERWGRDLASISTGSIHWNRSEWLRAGGVVLALGALSTQDHAIAEWMQKNRNSTTDRISNFVTPFGGARAFDASLALILTGVVLRNDALRDTGRDSLESEEIAAGIITPLIKRVAGRERPSQANEQAFHFHPGSKYESFPSGHATNSFAFATAVAQHCDGWLCPTIAYTVATTIAFSRMNENVHFATDVVAGAIIGRSVARAVVARHRVAGAPKSAWTITPVIVDRGFGLTLVWSPEPRRK